MPRLNRDPHGLPELVSYIHSKGLKYGHYTDAGKQACNKDAPMSRGYEHQDAFLFALEYNIDMVSGPRILGDVALSVQVSS